MNSSFINTIGANLQRMEDRFASLIAQPKNESEVRDTEKVSREDFESLSSDIRWLANAVGEFHDEELTEYYRNGSYEKSTRWDLFVNTLPVLDMNGIKTVIDLGSANNHFVYLAKKAGFDAYGIEPRRAVLHSSRSVFERDFGSDQKYGFVGTIKTFADYVLSDECDLLVDCVCVMNFLHGEGHVPDEIRNLYRAFEKCAKHILVTEPKWNDLGIERNENFDLVTTTPRSLSACSVS